MKRIAVIAVHGVGDQKPLESARRIGDLLQDLDMNEPRRVERPRPCTPPTSVEPQYDPFTERPVRINVRPVVIPSLEQENDARALHGPFHAWVKTMLKAPPETMVAPEDDDIATKFMRGQLRCYGGDVPEETYETLRLEGTRKAAGASRSVHVYELYWADLSRLKAGLFSIFTELYQLLFHLSSLGTHVVDAEATKHVADRGSAGAWRRFVQAQSHAAFMLTVPVPVLNLVLLALMAVGCGLSWAYKLPVSVQTVGAVVLVAAGVVAAIGVALWSRVRTLSVGVWLLPVWLGAFVVAGATMAATSESNPIPVRWTHGALAVIFSVAAAFVVRWLLQNYDKRRPGVLRVGAWIAGGGLLFGAALSWVNPPPEKFSWILFLLVRMFEANNALVIGAWGVFVLLAMLAFLRGTLAVTSLPREERPTAERGRWTARLTLSLPVLAFLIVTSVGWGLLSVGAKAMLGTMRYTPALPLLRGQNASTLADFIDYLVTIDISIGLPLLLTAAGLAALPAIWGMAPVSWAEVRPPSLADARQPRYARSLGDWLTKTFLGLRVSGRLLYSVTIFVLPIVSVLAVTVRLTQTGQGMPMMAALRQPIQALGAASGLMFAWLFSARGVLKKAALGFRSGLDILLDVDNWLREHPLSRNPRARICGRYVSLLRYIAAWKDPATGDTYDALVVIAHSQGTVITADLFRFLQIERDPELARFDRPDFPVYLFTMGCPLRQLYGLRFPCLYAWATHTDATQMSPWRANDLTDPPRLAAAPDPAVLGVKSWVNAYRSGDYIGRYLWRTDACDYAWDADLYGGAPANSTDGAGRREFCLGGGAHTHYWDDTARPIAWTLDDLIAKA